jgi:hypothetical protein
MRSLLCLAIILVGTAASAASKPHVISFGKPATVKVFAGVERVQALDVKVRPLLVDSRVKEFTLGAPHDITDKLFVVRRAFRINDALSDEPASLHLWRWERGGWLLVDRVTGRISPLTLPDFDQTLSSPSWYRDYAAYCGISDDGKRVSAIVAQLGRRKPLLKKLLETAPDSLCGPPVWQRDPPRVAFDAGKDQKFTFSIRGHTVDILSEDEDVESSE